MWVVDANDDSIDEVAWLGTCGPASGCHATHHLEPKPQSMKFRLYIAGASFMFQIASTTLLPPCFKAPAQGENGVKGFGIF